MRKFIVIICSLILASCQHQNLDEKPNAGDELVIEQARNLVENHEPQQGIDKLDTVKNVKNRDYYNSYGVAYDMLGKHDKAQEYLSQGRLAFPNDNLIKNNLGLSYALGGNYSEAEKIFLELTRKAEAKRKYFHNLAMVYSLTNREAEAKEILLNDMPEDFADETIKFYKEFIKTGKVAPAKIVPITKK